MPRVVSDKFILRWAEIYVTYCLQHGEEVADEWVVRTLNSLDVERVASTVYEIWGEFAPEIA
jgi:hypothetical protein